MTALIEKDHVVAAESPPAPTPRRPIQARWCWGLIALAVVMWFISLPSLGSAPLSQWGLLLTASPLFGGSMLVSAVAFVVCVRAQRFNASVVALLVMAMVQRLPTLISTPVPLYSWTYKHLGVVDYIQKDHQLAHGLDVYQGWPGLFAATAWFSDITGVDPVTLAHWFTPAFHLAMIGLVYAMARCWNRKPFPALVAAFLVESLNWVAQDYYSPQATALVLAVGFLIVVGLSRRHATAVPVALILFAAIVITHQLTPYWMMIAGLALTITRQLKPRWLIVAMIAMAGAYLAFNYDSVSHFSLLSFNPVQNAQSNIPTVGVYGQRVTSKIVRTLSVTMWLAAALGVLLVWKRWKKSLAPAIIAFSSFVLLGGQGYGGEAIFRVFLYSLIGCSLLIAPMLTKAITGNPPKLAITTVVLVACVAASAQGFYGGWFANRMSVAQVKESHRLLNTAEFPGFITVAAPVWPERSTARYVLFAASVPIGSGEATYDYPMIYSAKLTGTDFNTDASYSKFITTVGERTTPTYLIITRQMAIYDWYFGILPLNALDHLTARIRQDPRWTVYQDTNEYVIFKSKPSLIGAH